jgi:hypothetical protein
VPAQPSTATDPMVWVQVRKVTLSLGIDSSARSSDNVRVPQLAQTDAEPSVTDEARRKAVLAAVYARLRGQVTSANVSGERVRAAALEALANAKMDAELDRRAVDNLVDRLNEDAAAGPPVDPKRSPED